MRSVVGPEVTCVKAPPVTSAQASPAPLSEDSWIFTVTSVPENPVTCRKNCAPKVVDPVPKSTLVPLVAPVSVRVPAMP